MEKLTKKDGEVNQQDLMLFTGSSSIRLWNDINSRFPQHNIINRGFGGSTMSDLLYFADELIFKHQPEKIFIYEGDNDVTSGKTPAEILASADSLLDEIRQRLPRKVKVYFISAKPSIARWHLKAEYEAFNAQLRAWTEDKRNVEYIDVWSPMLQENGEVLQDIFIQDNLHMNTKGYDIWEKALAPYLK